MFAHNVFQPVFDSGTFDLFDIVIHSTHLKRRKKRAVNVKCEQTKCEARLCGHDDLTGKFKYPIKGWPGL